MGRVRCSCAGYAPNHRDEPQFCTMIVWVRSLPALLAMGLALVSCNRTKIEILKGRDFSNGNWLLVKEDLARNEVYIISDRKFLRDNSDGISVVVYDQHHYTTCDGTLSLFRDGELVQESLYLDPSFLSESSEIARAFKPGRKEWLTPQLGKSYQSLRDSLSDIPNTFPTRYRSQPDDVDIVRCYSLLN